MTLCLVPAFSTLTVLDTQCHRHILVGNKKVLRFDIQKYCTTLKLKVLVLISFSVPMTSSACCSTGVGEVHMIDVNNSLLKVKVITVESLSHMQCNPELI